MQPINSILGETLELVVLIVCVAGVHYLLKVVTTALNTPTPIRWGLESLLFLAVGTRVAIVAVSLVRDAIHQIFRKRSTSRLP